MNIPGTSTPLLPSGRSIVGVFVVAALVAGGMIYASNYVAPVRKLIGPPGAPPVKV